MEQAFYETAELRARCATAIHQARDGVHDADAIRPQHFEFGSHKTEVRPAFRLACFKDGHTDPQSVARPHRLQPADFLDAPASPWKTN